MGGSPSLRAREPGRGAPVLHNLQKNDFLEIVNQRTFSDRGHRSATVFFPNRASLKDRTCIQTSGASRQHQYASFGAPDVFGGDPPLEKSRNHSALNSAVPRL